MNLHKEINLEAEICGHLAANGWLYAEKDNARYDRQLALFPDDLMDWVQQTQPDAWDVLTKNHGESAQAVLMARLRNAIDKSGTLNVLRDGLDVLGLKTRLRMAQFKPASGINPDIVTRYNANRLRIVRQLRYSQHNELNIDLALFLNGVPISTAELKTDFTQSIDDAVDQYRFDRLPHPSGLNPEPLLSFPNGALVHFAVSNSEVKMTTKLAGPETVFLPFNQGSEGPGMSGAAGNPLNPQGHTTAYLWEQIWQRDSWLDILGRYMFYELDDTRKIKSIVFPRFHQLDVTRNLLTTILKEGPGHKYLIQHSAGSGKSKSIAWTAHFLADLHDASNKKVFDSVIVISDRTVIDGQLSEEIEQMQRKKGVVATIKGKSGSKSNELAEALSDGKKIVVCTIQTFPFALEEVRSLSATEGKCFAVIADEAHSSQSGTAATKLKSVLTAAEIQELEDGGEISNEDILAAETAARANDEGITFIAFTATPKPKTMEIFGRRPDPTQQASKSNLPAPFHVYSMQQAIDEGFILNVLENYISYRLAFKLANHGKEWDEKEVEHGEAMKGLMRWVRLHPYNIAQKVQIVVEHFREMVAPLLGGSAKAMVVTASRLEAVRWQIAIKRYIKEKNYPIKSLVAFSGEVVDKESGPDTFTETSPELNSDLKMKDFRKEFQRDYQILLVANKFQTGFDQPLLCGMYVDKKLDGIQAVQTLSRLNRCFPNKDKTYVLDFVNDSNVVLEAFKTYYTTATLEDVTDRNIVLNLRNKLDGYRFYDEPEIERVVAIELDPKSKQKQLEAAIAPVADRLVKQFAKAKAEFKEAEARKDGEAAKAAKDKMNALLLFRIDMTTFQRVYTFLSQIFDFGNSDFEKRFIFFKYLLRLLKYGREREGIDLSQVELTHHSLRFKGMQSLKLADEKYPELKPITEAGSGEVREAKKALLRAIIDKLNEIFGKETTDGDQLSYARTLREKTLESETLKKQALANTKEQFWNSPDLTRELLNAIIGSMDAQADLSTKAINSELVREGLKRVLIDQLGLYERLRGEVDDAA